MQEKILVLGGTGMLGQPVARRLKEDGYQVRLLVRDVEKARKLFDESLLTRNQMLKFASDLMAYFDKIGEMGDPTEANQLLGGPTITLDEWIKQRQAETTEMEKV
jgi:nucleoside-diphosphate-sugar epimerase